MGHIRIDIPQNYERLFEIKNPENAELILKTIEKLIERERTDEEDILGIWTASDKTNHSSSPI